MFGWARGRLADRSGVGGIVLAALAFHAIRRDEVSRDQAGVQPLGAQLPTPVVGALV
jgi:hypothetical protein